MISVGASGQTPSDIVRTFMRWQKQQNELGPGNVASAGSKFPVAKDSARLKAAPASARSRGNQPTLRSSRCRTSDGRRFTGRPAVSAGSHPPPLGDSIATTVMAQERRGVCFVSDAIEPLPGCSQSNGWKPQSRTYEKVNLCLNRGLHE